MKRKLAVGLSAAMMLTSALGTAPIFAAESDAAQTAIDERIAGGEAPTIVMAFMNFAGAPAGMERISEAISEYTMEKIGVKVELQIMDSASYSQNMTLMLASGEQVDLFNALTVGYNSCVNKDYCLDLNEDDLLATYGAGILETMDSSYIDACKIDGVLYGLPNQRDMASGRGGFAIGKEYLDEIGFDYESLQKEGEEIIQTDMDTISDIFSKLHEKFPDKYVFVPQETGMQNLISYDPIGGDSFGVLMDAEDSLEVGNLYTSDKFKEFCEMMYDWNQSGYISADAITDTNSATSQVKAGTAMSYCTALKPGIKQPESNLCGRDMIVFQTMDDFLKASAVAGMPWCINSMTEDPVATMQLLNLFYTDETLSNLLCWGQEGVDYKETDDGHITYADGVDAQNAEYYNNVNWEFPNQFIAKIWEGDSLDIWEKMEEFNADSVKSKALGFSFDNSAISSEYTALNNVYKEYIFQLIYGFTNPEEGIKEMESKMEAAGLQKYMDAKTESLNSWAETNGVK